MPDGEVLDVDLVLGEHVRIFRREPVSLDMPVLAMVMMEKPFLPAMPVMKPPSSISSPMDSKIIVPGWSGSLVLRMFSGMFFLPGKVPSCSTCAPM